MENRRSLHKQWLGVILKVVLIFGISVTCARSEANSVLQCPDAWSQDGDLCYRFFNIRRSWKRAAEMCRRYGSELSLIENYWQNNFTQSLALSNLKDVGHKTYWLGLMTVDDLSTNTLESAGGSYISLYMGFWGVNQPRPQDGSCVQSVVDGSEQAWALTSCETLLPFMCQKEACPKGSFYCSSGKCVNSKWKCDGQDDCGDMSDEMDCPKNCRYHFRSSGDSIQSPNYPNKYDPGSDCKWTLEGAVGTGIILQFSDFETESNFDTVQILAGGRTEESGVNLVTLSGSQDLGVKTFTTASNLVIVKFRSDASVEKKGFRASWKTESIRCGGELLAMPNAQLFNSPLYPQQYPGGLECLYIISAPSSKIITLEIVDLDFEPEKDFLFIRDGTMPSDPLLAKLTGNAENNPKFILSTQNKIYVYLQTSYGDSRRGFSIRFRAGCHVELTAASGNISSPAFGVANYPSNQDCSYHIARPGGGPLSLRFNRFDVAEDDFIQVFDGSTTASVKLHPGLGFSGGSRPSITLTASSGNILVNFLSNPMNTAGGWLASFSADCPKISVGERAIASSRETTFGARVVYICPVGQEFSSGGDRILAECMQGGHWNVSRIPGCQEKYCGPVPQIDNGFAVSANNVTYRGQAAYQCYAGFGFPSGRPTETIRCQETGKWEKLPSCLASSCPELPETPNAIRTLLNGEGSRYGTVIRFTCEPGYHRTGAPVLVCTSVGQWSYEPPKCMRASCPLLPEIENGFVIDRSKQYFFNDEGKIQCYKGYQLHGGATIKCGTDQTFGNTSVCKDIDECASSSCDTASTKCNNTDGSFYCSCRKGFEPNLECRPVGDLGIGNGNIPDDGIKASGTEIGYSKNGVRLDNSVGWCGNIQRPGENWIQFDLKAPTVLRGFRTQSVSRPDGSQAFPLAVRIQYSDDLTDLFKEYGDQNQPINFRLTHNGGSGLSIVSLPMPIEARYIRIQIMDFIGSPCLRIELMGCTRQDCHDINECLDSNGGCDHRCVNSPGSSSCLCNIGYDLYRSNGTNNLFIPPSETGLKDDDVYTINKTCVPKMCPALNDIENGKILASKTDFHFGDVVNFQCDFGYEMVGSPGLLCNSNGEWNGTVPVCLYAHCAPLESDPNQGLQVHTLEDAEIIPYLENVTFTCEETGRPLRGTLTSSFRQCVFSPQQGRPNYWLAGQVARCPRVDCGTPFETTGSAYGPYVDTQYQSTFFFGCEETFTVAGKSSFNDNIVRCTEDGMWDFGDLRCEGPVCEDPGRPPDGIQMASGYEHGSEVMFSCERPGYIPYTTDPITCVKNAECKVIKPIGLTSGIIPDAAINSTSERVNYEAKNIRLNSATGWCAKEESFTYVTVDLGRAYRIKSIHVKGVITDDVSGRPTELRFFYRLRGTQNFIVYFPNFNLTAREPGNYGELTVLDLPKAVQARQIILAIVSYNRNPCMKFELMGCEGTNEEVLLGYNNGYPVCVDQEPPHFLNCPDKPITVAKSSTGLQLINFTVPIAIDNSGKLARFEVRPPGFKPPAMIFEDTVVQYFAYDYDGNIAVCTLNITVPDDTPPSLSCPQSYVIELVEKQESYQVNFEEVRRLVNATDKSGEVTVQISPQNAFITLGGYRNVTVMASDRFGNQAFCHFQVSVQAAPCVSWSLEPPANGEVNCVPNESTNGFRCAATCQPGFKFTDGVQLKEYECASAQPWLPGEIIPDCVSEDTNKAAYDVVAQIEYRAGGAVSIPCLEHYVTYVRAFYNSLNEVLSGRCSAINVKMDIVFHNTSVKPVSENTLIMTYTLRITPALHQTLLYDLCGSTLGLIFDLSVPSTSAIIEPILNITSQDVGGQCPGVLAIRSSVERGFTCGTGEVLNADTDGQIPNCLHCPAGTYASMESGCIFCERGFYQDVTHQGSCKQCPPGTFTRQEGSKSVTDCVSVCGYGTYSPTGLVPCLQCPSNMYTGDPPIDGFRECSRCPANLYTYSPGSKSSTDCRARCLAGMYSETGLEPCAVCPVNFYQSLEGQTTCLECASTHATARQGTTSPEDCMPIQCSSESCQHGGLCQVQRHHVSCYCPAGFSGQFCEVDEDECASHPCYNGGTCTDEPQGYTCVCPPGFSGFQCQMEKSDCNSTACPERAMCQNLPGIGNYNCLCRSGYEGTECDVTVNPCTVEGGGPCSNGATCVPLLQGRYKCECAPGWTGQQCEVNIDDCAEEPCLLHSNCTDLVNDFRCDCPVGFAGKRCEKKVDLCAANPCVQGICVDRLFYHECVCKRGWTGISCDINVDDCTSNPCKNGGQCIDIVDGYRCVCDTGYTGAMCQHEIDSCENTPCQNGGTCLDHIDGFTCMCRPGFVGLQCEAEVDECLSGPCNAAGTETCIDQDNGFTCQCHPGYTGELCENNIDECASDPCLNGGTCSDGINTFVCQCPPEWTGAKCENDKAACDSEPCLNNAKCIDSFEDFFCVCPSGTDGKKCQTSPQRCIGSPCMHDGICLDYGSGLNCSCPAEYSGIGCEYEYNPCEDNVCENGATCKNLGETFMCSCAPGFTGRYCEQDIPDCNTNSCPTIATCIDLTNDFYCKCPFNLTGEDCRKPVNIGYDLYINDESRSSSVALAAPFLLNANSLSVGFWIQYNSPGTKGIYFTLYSVESAHLPIGKKVLVQADDTGVLISLHPDSTNDIFLRYLENVPINDGQWHHIVVMWDSTNGTITLMMDTALAGSTDSNMQNITLPKYGWVNLGAPLNEENKAVASAGFHGRLSRVNIWDRILDVTTEIPVQFRDCRNAPVLFSGLLLRWTGYDKAVGTVERQSPGMCGEKVCPVGYTGDSCHILHQDKTPPQLLYCPPDKWVISNKKATAIAWEEPRFTDDLRSIKITEKNGLVSGQSLTQGVHELTYVAMDEAGNTAKCSFRINIMSEFCSIPMPPIGGQLGCADWGPGGNFKVCTIACDEGLEFSESVPRFYTCGVEGFWRPSSDPGKQFIFPACATKRPARRIFKISMEFPSSVICSDSGRKILHDRLKQSVVKVNNDWNICIEDDSDSTCGDMNVVVKCNRQNRGKRQVDTTDTYVVTISFPAKDDPVMNKNTQDVSTVQNVVERAILRDSAFDVRNILPNVAPDLTSLDMATDYACPVGQVAVPPNCVECAIGTYYENSTQSCVSCPVGFYQNETGSLACKSCPPIKDRQGTTQSTGARSDEHCKEHCIPGSYYDDLAGTCQPCGYGYFQPKEGAFSCIPCGAGLTTRSNQAVSRLECREECVSGYELSESGECVPCQRGHFRTRGMPSCQQCAPGKTTANVASTDETDCSLDICQPGMYVDVSTDLCVPCPKGTYQNKEDRMSECQKCPSDTTTEGTGSTSVEECSNPCFVNGKQRICPANAACVYRTELDTYSCECQNSYVMKNNSQDCMYVCENYCENGGTCEVNPHTHRPKCLCPANFFGDNCVEKSEFVYVASGIAGSVIVIILLVLLVWMICSRSNRKRKLKKMPEPHMDMAGSQANFFYGAAAPYAESIAPSHHSTYAHYFEDEDDEGWEMPNFYNETYVQDGFHGKTNTLGHSNTSIYGTKEDLYDRLRKHQYMGKKGDSASESEDPPH